MYFAGGIIQIPIDHQIKDHGMIEEIVPGLLDRCASLYIAKQNNHLTFKAKEFRIKINNNGSNIF